MAFDVKIGNYSLLDDFNFKVTSFSVAPPAPKLYTVEIPGTSEVIDLTEAISGETEYQQRQLNIEGEIQDQGGYFGSIGEMLNALHGLKLKIVFSKNASFYWEGRVNVSKNEYINNFGTVITINAIVSPYKYEAQSSLEPWLWDTFSFEDGIIRNYYNITVPGSLTIVGRRKRVCPKIICSGAMTVTYLGNTYQLTAGENLITDIFIGEGEHVMTFGGSGTVSVDYRGGSL